MRCFIAIDIDDTIRAAVAELQQKLQQQTRLAKGGCVWVKPAVMHLTLKFLGEIKDAESVEVCKIAEGIAGRHKAFELDIEGVGHFGGKNARVLWIGTGRGGEQLCSLQQDLEKQLDSAGFPAEARKFSGHLTLCRIKKPKAGIELVKASEGYKDYKLGSIFAGELVVYQSRLTPDGPIYTALGRYKLQ
jgi:2'-5' RNA ligase